MSVNNFSSTSENRDVSRGFAEAAVKKTDTIGILFKLFIDPSILWAPFTSTREVSIFQMEEEILFCMQSSLPANHPKIKTVQEDIEILKQKL